MKVLLASFNDSKVALYKNMLMNDSVEIISLKDIKVDFNIEETGKTTEDRAIEKVKGYFELKKSITIAEDTSLIFENIKEEDQPGVNINKINGKYLTESERLDYYLKLINKYGGEIVGHYIKTVAICDLKKNIYTKTYKVKKIFTSKINHKKNPGYPLDSISITPEFNKYTVDLTKEENNKMNEKENKVIHNFIVETLKKIEKNSIKKLSELKNQKNFNNLINKIYNTTKELEKDYPKHKDWFYNKQIPNLDGVKREVLFIEKENNILGVSILKKDDGENKICTFYIEEKERGKGLGTLLMKASFEFLNTTQPLITISDKKIYFFIKFICKHKWTITNVLENYYIDNKKEIIFNEKKMEKQ